jgi:PH/SEC7 domain-containing protein
MANEVNNSRITSNKIFLIFHLAPFMRRSWKAYYASLRDMVLYLHKNDQQPSTISIGDTNAIRLHHAFAQEATDYRKRQHVFRLKTADWAEYLIQTSDHDLMKKWIDAINLIAASFSSPPLPAAIDSSSLHFQRPLLPSVQTRYSVVRISFYSFDL